MSSEIARDKLCAKDVCGSSTKPKQTHDHPPPNSVNHSISCSTPIFSQRIVNMDFYMQVHCSEFDPVIAEHRFNDMPRVPVLRIFGSTPRGQKTCAHVHGVFPYITILHDLEIDNFEVKIADALEKALNDFLKTAVGPNARNPFRRHIFKTVKIYGRTYYGYKHAQEAFLRLYFYNPFITKKVAELLLTGSIIGRKLQPYDAHIPYHLQFLIDYNLYGMNLVHYEVVKFRRKPGQVNNNVSPISSLQQNESSLSSSGVMTVWNLAQLPNSLFSTFLERASVSELEIDVCATDIVISSSRPNARSSNPGIDAIWQDEMERRRLFQGDNYSQVSIPESQSRSYQGEPFSTEALYKQILVDKLSKTSYCPKSALLNVTTISHGSDTSFQGILASQSVNHFSNISFNESNTPSTPIHPISKAVDDEDELYEIFKEFMKEKDKDVNEMGLDKTKTLLDDIEDEEDLAIIDADEFDDQRAEVEEQDWSQSFLSSSTLAFINDCENNDEKNHNHSMPLITDDHVTDVTLNSPKALIFQGDGQDGDDSDTCNKTSEGSRRSTRNRVTPRKLKDAVEYESKRPHKHLNANKYSERLSITNVESFSQPQSQPAQKKLRNKEKKVSSTTLVDKFNSEDKEEIRLASYQKDQESNPVISKKLEIESSTISRPCPKSKKKFLINSLFANALGGNADVNVNYNKVIRIHPSSKEFQEIIENNPVIRMERFQDNITVQAELSSCEERKSLEQDLTVQQESVKCSKGDKKDVLVNSLLEVNEHSSANNNQDIQLNSSPLTSQHDVVDFIKSKRNIKRRRELVASTFNKGSSDRISSHSCAKNPDQVKRPTSVSPMDGRQIDECETHLCTIRDPVNLSPESVDKSDISITGVPRIKIKKPIKIIQADQSSQTDDLSAVENNLPVTNTVSIEKTPASQLRSVEIQTDWQFCDVHACDCKSSQSSIIGSPTIIPVNASPVNSGRVENIPPCISEEMGSESRSEPHNFLGLECDKLSPAAPMLLTPVKSKSRSRSLIDVPNESVVGPDERIMNKSPDRNLSSYRTLFKKMLRKNQSSSSLILNTSSSCNAFSPTTLRLSPRKENDMSFFQIRRSASRSKSRKRRLKVRAKKLQANFLAPDIFRHEYEPLKSAPSYKRIVKANKEKQRDMRKHRRALRALKKCDKAEDLSSSQETTPVKTLRKYNVGSSSDDNSDSDTSVVCKQNVTPTSQPRMLKESCTPKSILRSACKSARQVGASGKRKIRWDDGSPKLEKVFKMEQLDLAKNNLTAAETVDEKALINNSELDGPSPKNKFGFAHDMSNLQDAKALHQYQYINVMSLELHCETRGDLFPDPAHDRITGIFIYVDSDSPNDFLKQQRVIKSFLICNTVQCINSADPNCQYFLTEMQLLQGFLEFYHKCDPDILVGYEIDKGSWGYLIRTSSIGFDLLSHLSRLTPITRKNGTFYGRDGWDGQIGGRIVLNLWKLLRHEITVQSYTYENTAYHILHRRVCRFNDSTLTQFWNDPIHRWRVLEYYSERAKGNVEIMNTLDMVNRTSELARLFGILFYEVLSRGSQFRVESMMLRVARSQSLIPVSPSVVQRAKMKAPEFLPLILEPKSSYYTDPVAVLDFQSLYPSMMIAYNYDYATVIGRVEHLGKDDLFELGCIGNEISPYILNKLIEDIHISPAGVAFVNSKIRKGVLPEMLEQILDTRQMVKRSMKKWKSEGATLQKILDSRQLGLKMIANVTYGYTSANFSGRMPCVDIADSVVSKGRETLQRAIDFVKSNFDKWGGEVIYGDTDSLFVLFRGRSRSEAFRLGQEIAEEVTKLNPKPVKLKFEKIYHGCILQSKKRYVGYSYETEDQVDPLYDAKGIETVRRDGCPAVKKILEKTLHILFNSNDSEKVKNFLQLQFKKLFTGRVSMRDYIFAREYRGRDGYKPGACVPSLEIAKKAIQLDPRSEPLRKQRVPYVIIYDKSTLPLIKLVRTPFEFANDNTLRLNAHYYIEKAIIPALNRCLSLAKMDVVGWYKSLPRKYLRNILDENKSRIHQSLDDFMHHANCLRCDKKTEKGVCVICDSELQKSTSFLLQVSQDLSAKLDTACRICVICSGEDDKCDNIDCPVYHKLLRYERDEHYNKQILFKLRTFDI